MDSSEPVILNEEEGVRIPKARIENKGKKMTDLTIGELLKWQSLKATIKELDSKISILKCLARSYYETDIENNESFWQKTIQDLNSRIYNLKKKRTELRKLFNAIDERV